MDFSNIDPNKLPPEEREKFEHWRHILEMLRGCPFEVFIVQPSNQNNPDSQHPEFDGWNTIGFINDYVDWAL